MKKVVLLMAGALFLFGSCAKAPATPTPPSPTAVVPPTPPTPISTTTATPMPTKGTPTPPEPVSRSLWDDTAYMALHPYVASVIQGTVEGTQGPFLIEGVGTVLLGTEKEQVDMYYSKWVVRVERYLVSPLPFEHINLLLIERFVADSTPLPHQRYSLEIGELAIFFLTRRTHERLRLGEGEFGLVGPGPAVQGVIPIFSGKVRIIRGGRSVEEPLEDFVSRLQLYAKTAGQ